MRLKYRICQDNNKNMLNIQEFIVDQEDARHVSTDMLRDDHFDLVAEQQYHTDAIERWVADGSGVVAAKLRTPNLFPIAPYAEKIAESVMALNKDGKDRCVELFFDDNDLFVADLEH